MSERATRSQRATAGASGIARRRAAADLAILAGSLGLFALLASAMAPFVPDDSFISYRYAENLAAGHGLVFNAGQAPVEGYSNFLWIVVLAAGSRGGWNLETAGSLLGGLFGLMCVALLWWLLRRLGRMGWDLAAPVALLALSPPFILYSISGMETPLFAFLLLAIIGSATDLLARPSAGRGLLLALVGVLAALARPEGVLALPVVTACLLAFEWRADPARRRRIREGLAVALAVFLALLAVYHVGRAAYFGAFWPTPFLSKGASGGSPADAWITNLRQFFLRQSNYYAPHAYYYATIGLAAAVGAALAWRAGRRRPVEWAAFLLALAFAALYVNFVDWMPGMRYYAPLVGLWLIPFSLLGPELREAAAAGRRGTDPAYLLLTAALGIFSLSGLATLRLDSQQLQAGTQEALVGLGRWLREAVPPDAVLAMSDVGATPYYSGLTTIDINPESLTDRTIAENGWSADYFFSVDPDVVVLTAFSLTRPDFYGVYEELYAMPRFREVYERIGIVRNDWYQDRSYWVFVRRGAVPPPEQMAVFPAGIRKP